jgi:hypothetical protein
MATESIDDLIARLHIERRWSQACLAEQLNEIAGTRAAARSWYAATDAAQPRRGSACPHRVRPHGRPAIRYRRRMEQQ